METSLVIKQPQIAEDPQSPQLMYIMNQIHGNTSLPSVACLFCPPSMNNGRLVITSWMPGIAVWGRTKAIINDIFKK
jgi:hypothetical protein